MWFEWLNLLKTLIFGCIHTRSWTFPYMTDANKRPVFYVFLLVLLFFLTFFSLKLKVARELTGKQTKEGERMSNALRKELEGYVQGEVGDSGWSAVGR